MDSIRLPPYVKQAIEIILLKHPEYQSPQGSTGKCVKASDQLLFQCDELLNMTCDGYLDGDDTPHHWAVIEGICIDLTARQFDPDAPCPKIWLSHH